MPSCCIDSFLPPLRSCFLQGVHKPAECSQTQCISAMSTIRVEPALRALCAPGKHQSPARQTQNYARHGHIGNGTFFRMLDGDRPYLGSFLSCIGNSAGQKQGHSDNQQDKPDSKFVHLRLPSFSPSTVNSGSQLATGIRPTPLSPSVRAKPRASF